jgi:hypothetical protein
MESKTLKIDPTLTLKLDVRKGIYRKWIDEGCSLLETMLGQQEDAHPGCFFLPYVRGETNYSNARWQEVVLFLSCENVNALTNSVIDHIRNGVLFWVTLQNPSGSLPQYCQRDNDFSATAFSSYAISKTLNNLRNSISVFSDKERDTITKSISKTGQWLAKNDELIYTNQQVASSLALFEISRYLDNPYYERLSRDKLRAVLRSQKDGIFLEKRGFDIGYSTLTLELLARYFLGTRNNEDKDMIMVAVELFLDALESSIDSLSFGDGTRGSDWVVTGGFEVFSTRNGKATTLLDYFFQTQDVRHLPDYRHVFTDLYRLSFAHDNAVVDLSGSMRGNTKVTYGIMDKTETVSWRMLRPYGLHRFRRWV